MLTLSARAVARIGTLLSVAVLPLSTVLCVAGGLVASPCAAARPWDQ